MSERTNCSTCYSSKLPVRLTQLHDYPVCGRCEQHLRNGLVHYRPSNGSEFMDFEERCCDCRHFKGDDAVCSGKPACDFGILDRFYTQTMNDCEHISNWFDPADLKLEQKIFGVCQRFTDRNDPNGELRDPPKPDCEGQLFFGDLPVERREPVRQAVPA